MNDLGVPARQQRERPAGPDHIHRLPQAVEDQDRLIKRSFHDEVRT